MPPAFLATADLLDDLSAIFEARRENGGFISASQAASAVAKLTHAAEMIRLGERQRVPLLAMLDRPVVDDDLTVVLTPFRVIRGGRA
jgi:uncharacterized protein (DUF1778 family)